MRSILYLILCTYIFAIAQSGDYSQDNAEWKMFYAKQAELRERGTKSLEAEYVREKLDVCPNATITLVINECLDRELKITEKNYVAYLRALGGLLRLEEPGREPIQGPDLGKELDKAELLWKRYRETQCRTSSDQYFGGTIRPSQFLGCKLKMTRRHMHELDTLYKDLWNLGFCSHR